MRQDPSAVPHPRASHEQISYQPDQDQQASYRQAPPLYPTVQHPGFPDYAHEDPGYGAYDPAYDLYDAAARDPGGWQGIATPRFGDPEAEAALARVRVAQRKARRMQVVCALLGACAAAIFLAAAASHQLDGHIEMLTPVLLLTSSGNVRRYAQRLAEYRAAEADILARAR
jgi:hypothetical protein